MKESSLKERVLIYLNSLPQCKAIKIHGDVYTEKGTPDICCCYQGRAVWIELKVPGETPDPIQLKRLKEWQEAGAVATWVDNIDDVKKLMEKIPGT